MSPETAKVVHEILDELRNGDLEQGSHDWNNQASEIFNRNYPFLSRKLSQLERQANEVKDEE